MNQKKLEAEDIFKLAFESHKKNNLQNAENLYKDAIKQKSDHINSIFYLAGLYLDFRRNSFESVKYNNSSISILLFLIYSLTIL